MPNKKDFRILEASKNQVFFHHIYEYKKGLRNLILHTTFKEQKNFIEQKLKEEKIDYLITVMNKNINVYFGHHLCIEIIKSFGNKELSDLTPKEDFILGVLLGYCPIKQCQRYLDLNNIDYKDCSLDCQTILV